MVVPAGKREEATEEAEEGMVVVVVVEAVDEDEEYRRDVSHSGAREKSSRWKRGAPKREGREEG